MDWIRTLLEQQPLAALFLTIALGYLAGEANLKGFSLGIGAVLFVALFVGWFAPKAVPAAMVGTLGLALFLYAVGIQYGKQFAQGLASTAGQRANLIALVGVSCAGAAALAIARFTKLSLGHALGLFAGSGTSTPTLQAAVAALGNDDAAIGYAVSYPLGVAGPILLLSLGLVLLKPKMEPSIPTAGMELLEVALRNPQRIGRTLGEAMSGLPSQVKIVALRTGGHNQPAGPGHIVRPDDVVLVVAPGRDAMEQARKSLGEVAAGEVVHDRSDFDLLRVFASRAAVVGRPLGQLAMPGEAAVVAQVRRGDTDVLPRPALLLDYGDRVGILARREDFAALRRFFGDSIKGTAEFSYISIGLGIALGLLLGAVRLPLPGIGGVSIGLSGVLIVALVLGKLQRTAGVNWAIPLSANLVLRNLGLTLFLAQVGMTSGPKFAAAVTQSGLQMVGLGAIVLLALVLPILVLGLWVFRLPYDEVAGIVSGACGSAVLAYATKAMPTERPDIGYAMIYPGTTIAKILFVSIAPATMG